MGATSNSSRISACAAVPGHVLVGDPNPQQDKCLDERLSGDRRQGWRPTRRWTNHIYATSAPGDCSWYAGPVTSPKVESVTNAEGGTCEFAIGRVPFHPLPKSVEIANARYSSRHPVVTQKACDQQQPRGNRTERQCHTQSQDLPCDPENGSTHRAASDGYTGPHAHYASSHPVAYPNLDG